MFAFLDTGTHEVFHISELTENQTKALRVSLPADFEATDGSFFEDVSFFFFVRGYIQELQLLYFYSFFLITDQGVCR